MWQSAVLFLVLGCVSAQNYRVCIPATDRTLCNNLDRDGSQAICEPVESRIDCAIKLARGTADIGFFDEEETLLLGQQQPNAHSVVATIRDVSRTEPYAFEAVAIVSNTHVGGIGGLRGANYCHPGFGQSDQRWSPRVLKAFEQAVVGTDRCPNAAPAGKTVEELEAEAVNEFFASACRPGPWSYNSTVDARLKSLYPNLCALCGSSATGNTCSGYTLSSYVNAVSSSGVNNNNNHIQALECLRTNNNSVSYVAWRHVQEYFNSRPDISTSYAVLCPDNTTRPLTAEILINNTSPCAFVRQPWSTIVANSQNAPAILASLRTWWPSGASPGGNSWQAVLFGGLVGGSNARVFYQNTTVTPLNYTSASRDMSVKAGKTSTFAAVILVGVNFIVMLFCAVVFGLALWMISSPGTLSATVQGFTTPAVKALLNPQTLTVQLGVGLGALTIFFFCLSFMGLYGAVTRSQFLLFMYATLILLLLLLECALLFYFSSNLLEKGLQEQDGQWTHALRLASQCCEHNATSVREAKLPWSCCGAQGYPDNCTTILLSNKNCNTTITHFLHRYTTATYASLAALHIVIASCAIWRRARGHRPAS